MNLRLLQIWADVRASYWFVPLIMALGAAILALATVLTDTRYGREVIDALPWLFSGGADGARAVLATIAGSMITVAGTTFSITIVALALASAQFGPRLLRNFMRDTGNQVVLGTFLATFLYCLLILRTIRSVDERASFVPYLAVTVGVALGVASIGVLIYFIHHVAVSIQAPHVIARAAEDFHRSIDRLFPEDAGEGAAPVDGRSLDADLPDDFDTQAEPIRGYYSGYVEAMDAGRLMEIAEELDLVLRLEARPGDFVIRDEVLMRVWPSGRLDESLLEQLHRTVVLGVDRTARQDVELPLDQLVEVAVRALSPGINDPFTAINCIDHIGAGLCHLARRRMPSSYRLGSEGRLRLVLAEGLTFADVVDAGFNQIRQNAGGQASVRVRMLQSLGKVLRASDDPAHHAPLLRQAEMIRRGTQTEVTEPQDRLEIERYYARAVKAAGADRQRPAENAADPGGKSPA